MTLIVNLYAGPSAGKSTIAAELFAELKKNHVCCELIQEYAKDRVWEEDYKALECQPFITAKQLMRIHRCLGKVDVLISDSPLLLGLIYGDRYVDDNWKKWLINLDRQMNTLNWFIYRPLDKFEKEGRIHDFQQSLKKDKEILQMLNDCEVEYSDFFIGKEETKQIYDKIMEKMK